MTPADIAEMRRRIAQGDPIGLIINTARLLALLDEVEKGRARDA